VSTLAVGVNSLPVGFTKTFGLVNATETTYNANQQIAVSPVYSYSDSGGLCGFFDYEGVIWVFMKSKYVKLDYDGNEISSTDYNTGGFAEIYGAAIDERTGRVYVLHVNGLSTVDLYTNDVDDIVVSAGYGYEFCRGIYCRDGVLMMQSSQAGDGHAANQRYVTYDIGANEFGEFFLSGAQAYYDTTIWDSTRKVFYNAPSGTGSCQVFDYAGKYVGVEDRPSGTGGGIVNHKRKFWVTGSSTQISVFALESVKYAGRLYVQDGGDISTKREYNIMGEYIFAPRGDGVVLRGNIVSAILQGLDIAGGVREDYLDYVVSIEYTDGLYRLKKNAGSSSFAWRGYADWGELYLESESTINILPEYLTAQI
jgi:hypothetical protein